MCNMCVCNRECSTILLYDIIYICIIVYICSLQKLYRQLIIALHAYIYIILYDIHMYNCKYMHIYMYIECDYQLAIQLLQTAP